MPQGTSLNIKPRILITAGPTYEPIDAVRYIGNRSSGRMGIALACESLQRGWPTTLLLGPTCQQPPESSQLHVDRFQTTSDLQRLLQDLWPDHDVLIMAAAVSDFRPAQSTTDPSKSKKIRRSDQSLTLDLEPTPDLLQEAASHRRKDQFVLGFALEPADDLMASAQSKLLRKRIDAIVANPLETMDSATIDATLLLREGPQHPPRAMPKSAFSRWLFDALEPLIAERLSQS